MWIFQGLIPWSNCMNNCAFPNLDVILLKHLGRLLECLNLSCQGILGGFPYCSPPFGVTSAEVAIICPETYTWRFWEHTIETSQIAPPQICVYNTFISFTLPETNNSHLKIGRAPKGNNRIPTIHFQGRTVSFREGIHLCWWTKIQPKHTRKTFWRPQGRVNLATEYQGFQFINMTHAGTMGLAYLPTWMVDFYGKLVVYRSSHGSYG